MLLINKWYGQLSNNIISLFNIVLLASRDNHTVLFEVKHPFFNLKIIENYFSKNKIHKQTTLTNGHCFFGYVAHTNYAFEWEDALKKNPTVVNLIREAFVIKDHEITKLDENDIVVHIRSGGIFVGGGTHPWYVPPPLSYYTKQLNKRNYNKIIIVSEDNVNPVVNKLLELYKNSTWKKNHLTTDIKLILGATNIISSVGTFVFGLLLFSKYIKNHYGEFNNNKELQGYYKHTRPWKNTNKQRDYILTYQID